MSEWMIERMNALFILNLWECEMSFRGFFGGSGGGLESRVWIDQFAIVQSRSAMCCEFGSVFLRIFFCC